MNRAKLACTASCAAGFFTLPFFPLVITLGFVAGGEVDPGAPGGVGWEWLAAMVMWASAAGLALGLTGFALGWLYRRELELRHTAGLTDGGLARAGELLGAGVSLLALFLLMGSIMHAGNQAAATAAARESQVPPAGMDQPK